METPDYVNLSLDLSRTLPLPLRLFFSRFLLLLCPRLPKAGVGHIAFRRDVTSVRAYVRMSRS